jgi:protein required for attachment to host cells
MPRPARRAGALKAPSPVTSAYRRSAMAAEDVPTRVVVADAAHARFYAAPGLRRPWTLQHTLAPAESESETGGRMGERGDNPKDVKAVRFAKQLAQALDQAFAQGAYQLLVVVGPPRFLGLLRGALQRFSSRQVREVERDYAHLRDDDVRRRVLEQL